MPTASVSLLGAELEDYLLRRALDTGAVAREACLDLHANGG